jgi:AhpD family alkylhydroperoxidase
MFLASTVFGADLQATVSRLQAQIPAQTGSEEYLPAGLVQLIALATSLSSGCRYCQAHTSHNAHRSGQSEAKLAAILNYSTSDLYNPAERAVLDLAFAAGRVPNEAAAHHFSVLQQHFSKRQIAQIVAVISLFGFLNRWNDSMATTLESTPGEFATHALAALDWSVGKHN